MEQNPGQHPACQSIFKDGRFVTNTEIKTAILVQKMTKTLSCDILLLEQLVPILKEIWT